MSLTPHPKSDSERLLSSHRRQELGVSGLELWQWWQEARQQAIAAAIPAAEVDWLLQELAGLERLELRLESFKARTDISLKLPLDDLTRLWQQRIQERIPVQYLTGTAPWREFSLQVSPAVLIPRPETEIVIDLAVKMGSWGNNSKFKIQNSKFIPPHPSSLHWADLGTGSGAIALGLAVAFPEATIHAVDCSAAALAIAKANAAAYNLTDRIHFYQGSWLEPLQHLKGKLSGIVSNPPYIPSAMVPELQPEVAQHEPHLALDGGLDGLDWIRQLVAEAPDYLRSQGIWLVEMMAGQAKTVTDMLRQQGSYHDIQIHPDLAGIERFAIAYRN
ncbi:MAG: peptide chain release factor N(5)-glutamine methyltransferase [Leptolyngbyaceae cyanobacterium RU_5_1]|nr:peptide chain release factor N(5)-glutamine methyltransferase [Leptolyngbyaceae cyanobacterium RU_5_1]